MRPLAALAAAALFGAAACTGAVAEARLALPETGLTLSDALYRTLGSTTEAIGDKMFLKAETYYHGGATHGEESAEDHAKEGVIGEDREGAAPEDWISGLYARGHKHVHYHLQKAEKKEMLPFFAMAVRLDPHNVEAVLSTAWWLEREYGMPDQARKVLEDGRRDNPSSWEIPFRLAELHFKRKEWGPAEALSRESLKKSAGQDLQRHFFVDMHFYLAESLYQEGKKAESLEFFRGGLGFYKEGEKSLLKDRLAARVAELSASEV